MTTLRRWTVATLLAALALLTSLAFVSGAASAQPPKFDHDATGYALRGQHENVRCETCHLRAIFKGTPRDCATCHAANNPRGALQMPARHFQTQRGCDECHSPEGFGGTRYDHFDVVAGGCTSCHDGIRAPGKGPQHLYTTASCDQCHNTSSFLGANALPPNHIPFAAGTACSTCHQNPNFAVMPSLSAIHANLPSTATSCGDCHGAAAASFAIPASGFAVVGLPANHIPTSQPCELCHTGPGTGMPTLPVGNGAKFAGALMSHNGITSGCANCHTTTPATFAGIAAIVGMPPTSPMGPNAHIPTQAACESCHLASVPALPVPATATKAPPGSGFATPAPTTQQIHAGVSSGCNSCHDVNAVWMGVGAYPIAPATLVAGAQYTGFQTRPQAAAGPYNVADAGHPKDGDCSQCHSNSNAFTAVDKPANHIPYAAGAQCNSCHTGSDFSVQPTLTNIHAWAPSTGTNCAQCHGTAAASFAIPAANFSIVGLPANHLPTSVSCESCHVGPGSSIAATPVVDGAKFTNSLMNHAGITSGCAGCHQASGSATAFAGITRIVGMPATSPVGAASHIPSSTTCENCHLGSTPSGFMAANATATAPGTAFQTPAPTTQQIHTGVSSGCAACHDSGAVWMGVAAYPIIPSSLVAGSQYQGFQTRPRTAAGPYNVADPQHPATGDCSQCHASTLAFTAVDKPANHIPYAPSAQCSNCHQSNDYSVQPSVSAIHAYAPSSTSNCTQCHGSAAPSFAIPAANFSIVGLPANHLPTSASCEVCHVGPGSSIAATPVLDGAKFAASLMNHAGITNNCVSCHVAGGAASAFAGIARVVAMPPTSPAGAGSHIPSATTCETCHIASMPAGLVAASATKSVPGTGFATPVPTGLQIHSGVSSGCAACHEAKQVWLGVSAYPISPSTLVAGAQYKGFQTRPQAGGGTYQVADPAHPAGGDCSQCHGNTTAFTGVDKPANHIPIAATAQCNNCHTVADYAVQPTLANIHAYAPSAGANCAQCHGAAAASFAIPAANFSIVGLPANHIPTSASCEVCHVGAGSSIAATPVGNGAKFSGSLMNHAGIANNCAGCHLPNGALAGFTGIARLIGQPTTTAPGSTAHIPSGPACESCHLASLPPGLIPASATANVPGTAFATPAPTGVQIHNGVSSGCSACHDTGAVWVDSANYPISPSALTAGAQYRGFQTRPLAAGGTYAIADPAHPASGDCSQCHASTTAFTAVDKPANHIPTLATATCNNCHTGSDYAVRPTLTAIHAYAPSSTANCAQCHGSAAASFAIPAANFSIVGLPVNHLPTSASCEVCHVGPGSSIAATPVVDGAKFSGSLMTHTGITNGCAACHVAAGTPASFAGVTAIVGMPVTSPAGPASHIPSSTTCENCHLAATPTTPLPASATKTAPGTAFATPAPTTAQIHNGVTSGCIPCHESSAVWMGVGAYPIAPSTLVAGAQYTGFQTRPRVAAGTYNVADPAHPVGGDCAQCHASTNAFTGVDKPTNHIPYVATAQCNSCHTGTDYSVQPSVTAIHANAPSTSTNCAQCHGAAAASFAIPAANFSIVGLPSNHIPTSASCEVCHVGAGSSIAATPVQNGARFASSLVSHSGITNGCAACHVPAGTSANFIGIANLIGMPATSPVGASSHIPSGTACESCHIASVPAGLIPASATKSVPGSGFATPAPTTVQIHTGISGGCSTCHEANYLWVGVGAYPIAPATLTAGASYTGFHTRPQAGGGSHAIADPAHPTSGDCGACHSNTLAFTAIDKPANHIPVAATASCSNCHTSTDFSVLPTLANIHAYAPSTSANCAQCHGSAAASFAIPAANFSIVGLPSNHIPTSASCEVCHVGAGSSIAATPVGNGAKFAGSLMSHAGINSNCVACHVPVPQQAGFIGIATITKMPQTSPVGAASHIPSSTSCETCHLGSTPSGLIPASATTLPPGTTFANPAPTTTQIHTGITAGCASCHEASNVWMGMGAYPIAPSVLTAGASYTGFHARPGTNAGTYTVADPAHPASGDCSQCHAGTTAFTGVAKPANHIPYAANAACNNCHTSADYSVLPTLTNIHAWAPSTSANCAQCHGSAAATYAIPAANFSIVGLPANHLPTSASCEVCHVGAGSSIAATPVVDGAKFAASRMNHAGLSNGCVACHVAAGTPAAFIGVTAIVGMPPTSPAGVNAHIPSGTACENCHLAAMPSGLVAASATKTAPGTAFATPAPTTAQIHGGITSGCTACHERPSVWMGMGAYPIAPSTLTAGASYTGFQTRPGTTAGTYNVADPAHPTSGDCAQCHSNTNAFTGVDKPANHIPYAASAQCNSCHTSSDFSVQPTVTAIHANAPSTSANCAQCHGSTAASFAIPAANFSIVGLPATHIPTTASCEVCHVGAGSSIAATPVVSGAKFAASLMNHAGIGNGCVACHTAAGSTTTFTGITRIVGMPPTSPVGVGSHIPSNTSCETCHLATLPAGLIAASATKTAPGTAFANPAPNTAQIHTGISGGCASCHDTNAVWMGTALYPIAPTTLSAGASYTGFHSRPTAAGGANAIADAAHPASGDCSQCHAGTAVFTGVDKPANHIPYVATAQCSNCHTGSDYAVMPTLANIHAYAPNVNTNCAQCHGSAAASFAIPAANFSIVGLPPTHIPTSASCEVCHVGTGSSVTALPVGNGAKFANSQMNHSGIASNCVACHVAPGGTSSFAGIARVVPMPPTSPVGATSHIPSNTSCETCHLATMPAGYIAATATATAPGTAFANPAPSTAQIHTGISSGCTACHEAADVWMGMGAYPIAPSTLSPGASYTGFHARPTATAGPYTVADPSHPASGDCVQCHANTTAFTAADKPSNHIPTAATATCDNCHTSSDYSVLPTLANIHAYAPSTTSNCAQCHGSAAASFAIPAASFSIVGLPSNHLPTSASCEVCHVGAGSSIATLPVPNGAKFAASLMNHAGIANGCASCHVPAGTPAAFAGVKAIVGMPATTPMGSTSHIPSATACESCHLQTLPVGLIPASATKTAPGTAFATPAPTTVQIHAGITSGCTACHEASYVWMGMTAYPIAPSTLTAGASYTGFQTRPRSAAGTYNVADPAHPASGDCAGCHASTTAFTGVDKPANHIPYAATATCNACHTSSDYSVAPTLTAIHANAPSTSANCAQCHGSAAASFAIPAANFSIVGLPSNHIPTSSSCEACHVGTGSSIAATPVVNGAKFAGSLMSHAGIGTGCNTCHVPAGTPVSFIGVTSIVGMPPTSPMGAGAHLPTSTTCETCHATSSVAGLIPASATKTAPGTLFATPVPTTAQIHTGVASGCTTCHEANYVWMGVGAYPIAPKVITAGAQYTGFQTRPVTAASTYGIADPAHPSSGDCVTCHLTTSYFVGVDKPANHIPYAATAQCSNCHTGTDYSVLPTLANIHAYAPSTSANCAQCHGSAAATFAIPAANFSIVGLPSNHIPTTASCEVCHVGTGSSIAATPVPNGAKFAGSRMSHSGIAAGCNSCHLTAGSVMNFVGITKLVGMPATTPVGSASHIPSSATCENCHGTSSVPGLIPASASKSPPGTLFNSPTPTTAQIHTGITSGCNACHDTGYVWMGVSAYPIAPTTVSAGAQYTGFQTRPVSAAGVYSVADAAHPASGDCSNCHTGTNYFSGAAKPAGHIPTSGTCATCHIVAGDYTIAGLASNTVLHTGITSGCANCHAAGPFAGSGPTSSTLCTTAALPYQPVPKPLTACGASPTASNALNHIPVGSQACELCHGSTVFTSFKMSSTTAMRPTTTTGPVPGTTMHTSGVPQGSFTCMSCHEYQYKWMGVSIRTRDSASHHAGQDCANSGCHRNTSSQFMMEFRPIPVRRAAVGAALPRLLPQLMGGAGSGSATPFDHRGVTAGQCQTCHNGQLASGRPARHYGQRLSCDSCHRTTAWRPAQFSHNATMAGQCAVCHNGVDAPAKTGNHFVTVRSCDACHRTLAWQPVQYQHLSPAYQPMPDKPSCISCHVTNNEVIPRQMHGHPGLRPVPVPGK